MRLRRIELEGFGCLKDFRAEFASGINVVFGLNEAGKSTLQQAICAMLYGFYEGERGKADEKRRHERFRPWAGGSEGSTAFRGVLDYEMQAGEAFEVRRDFSSPDLPTQLIDLALSADVTSRFGQGRHGNVPFARSQLGMSRGVFQSCAFIAQGEIFGASQGASPREIGDAIAAMADSARRDVSAAAALGRLDALMLRIGSDRARTAELPKARENLREAETELAVLDSRRSESSVLADDLDHTRARLAAMEGETLTLQARYLVARQKSLARRLAALNEAEGALERAAGDRLALRGYNAHPVELRDRVVALRDRWLAVAERVERAREELAVRSRDVTDDVRLDFESLRLSVGQLSAASIKQLDQLAYAPAPAEKPGVLARLVTWLATTARVVFVWLLRRREAPDKAVSADADRPPLAGLTQEEATSLLDRHRRYLMLRPVVESQEAALAHLRQEEEVMESAANELGRLLKGGDGNLDNAVEGFLQSCARKAEHDAAVVAEGEAEKRRDALLGSRTRDEIEALLEETSVRVRLILAAHPELEPPDIEESTTALGQRIAEMEEERHKVEIAGAKLEEELRAAMSDHRPRAEVEEDVERWRREVAYLEKRRTAAAMARELIDEAMTAVYRDFAPAVSSFLSDGFAHVTEGRYQRALVDPRSLEVSLLVPETQQVIKDPPVSRGTLALAYILMRIGLAQHMSAVAEPVPLVLDDPFVDLDGRRLRLMMEFLSTLSARMQILLFTKDPAVVQWLETSAPAERHRLLTLTRETAAAPAM
jgi:DNA repair exonuclease SbcCD ATPase subunit